MIFILAIETTTKNCSIALFKDEELLHLEERKSDRYLHAEQLTVLIEDVIIKSDISLKDLSAIALSKGPGSYTGLRIGTSTAKGLCYALGIPLIAISTLRAMACQMAKIENFSLYCPMIDARRMEVFAAIFDKYNNQVRNIHADIVDVDTYSKYLIDKVLFFGDGAIKCEEIINDKNAFFKLDILPSAKNLAILAFKQYNNKEFEDIAYFEPFYLKDFIAY